MKEHKTTASGSKRQFSITLSDQGEVEYFFQPHLGFGKILAEGWILAHYIPPQGAGTDNYFRPHTFVFETTSPTARTFRDDFRGDPIELPTGFWLTDSEPERPGFFSRLRALFTRAGYGG